MRLRVRGRVRPRGLESKIDYAPGKKRRRSERKSCDFESKAEVSVGVRLPPARISDWNVPISRGGGGPYVGLPSNVTHKPNSASG